MQVLHSDADAIFDQNDLTKQIGWRIVTPNFTFDAVEHEDDGTISTYVEWGDDQPGDMASHGSWEEAQSWLDSLLQASLR